jgi:hypothetical protein
VLVALHNQCDETLNGEVQIDTSDQSLMAYGQNHFRFADFRSGNEVTFSAQFIAIVEGDFTFPAFSFVLAGSPNWPNFVIKPTDGVLVVGNLS